MSAHPQARQVGEALARCAYREWLGIHVLRAGSAGVELLLPYRDEFGGEAGAIHRSVVAALAEAAGEAALTSAAPREAPSLRLDHLRAAPAGNELYASARIVGGQAQVEIRTNDDRALVARATLVSRAAPSDDGAPRPPLQPSYPV